MPELHEIHQGIREKKKEKSQVHEPFKDALRQSQPYQQVVEELKALKVKKTQIENTIREEFSQELEKIEKLGQEIKTDAQLLSDMAMTKLMKGETVEITDENDVKYEPVFKVSFKKVL